jgi:hypothetical protein
MSDPIELRPIVTLRMPHDLHEQIAREARLHGRDIKDEVQLRLTQSFSQRRKDDLLSDALAQYGLNP